MSDDNRNATQAYVRAGYSPVGADHAASRQLRKAKIAAEIHRLETRLKAISPISPEEILQGIREDIELAREIGQMSTAMRGWELLGKQHGLFRDVVENVSSEQIASRLQSAHNRAKKRGRLIGHQLVGDDKVLNIQDLHESESANAAGMQQDEPESIKPEPSESSG